MKKKSGFKMKGFGGFGNSPLKKTPPKSTRKDNLRAISGFEADFPKLAAAGRVIADTYSPKKNLNRAKTLIKRTKNNIKKGVDYFKAK